MFELFANGGDPDQMPQNAASDLGLYFCIKQMMRLYRFCLWCETIFHRKIRMLFNWILCISEDVERSSKYKMSFARKKWIFLFLCETYVVGRVVLMCTANLCFCWEVKNTYGIPLFFWSCDFLLNSVFMIYTDDWRGMNTTRRGIMPDCKLKGRPQQQNRSLHP